jgi:hypothetical protein
MKTTLNWKKRFLIPGAITAFALVAAPFVVYNVTGDLDGVVASAYAAGGEGKGGKGYHGGRDSATAGPASTTASDSKGKKGRDAAPRGRRSLEDVLRDESEDSGEDGGEDSDRPDWAGTPGKEGKPGGGSAGSDTRRGSDYGDLWIILRDDDGNPILVRWVDGEMVVYPGSGDTEGWYPQPLAADGSPVPLDEEGHPLDESLTQEVELGRLNIARAPSRVLDHSLDEAVTKLDGLVITADNLDEYTDVAGRLSIDGATIDSPLENLALYQALVNTAPDSEGNVVITVNVSQDGGSADYTVTISSDVSMQLAAAAFAAASDKTGTLSVDGIAYISGFLDVDITATVDTFTYNREDVYDDQTVWILVETSPGIFEPQEVEILDVISFNSITPIDEDGNGIDTFTQAADDALQVIEYVHDNALDQ